MTMHVVGRLASAQAVLAELSPGIASQGPETLSKHSHDSMVRSPDGDLVAVCFPRTTAEVAEIMGLCHRYGVSVVPQGGLTGYAGGATPTSGSIALSLSRMVAVGAVDREGATIIVEAGAILEIVQRAALEAGMMVPVDLGARGSCTVGGIVATNAGGNRVLRYGMTRDMVLGLEIVTADGTIIDATNTMLKNNTGYDLKHLFIGSEGTLGVITRVVCRLVPKPRSICAALCGVADYDSAMQLLRHMRRSLGTQLSAFEVMWPDFYDVVTRERRRPLAERHGLYVLVDMLGLNQDADQTQFEAAIGEVLESGIVQDATVAQSLAQADALWDIRESTSELGRLFGQRVPFDISVPTAEIGAFTEVCRGRLTARWPDVRSIFFGHVADGNLHLAVAVDDGISATEIKDIVYGTVGEWHGSVSAEHGIGTVKIPYLSLTRSPEELALMRAIKSLLDPRNICNPGKIFPTAGRSDSPA